MPDRIKEEASATLRFGGGLHTRASEADIDQRECSDGENFALDIDNLELRNRKPFDKIGQVPNSKEIRGGVTLLQTDGTVKAAFQAGDKVYDWDGSTTFTEILTVNENAKLRGRLEHNWFLDDKVLVTDLTLNEGVMEWDGGQSTTNFTDVSFTNESGSAFGTFKAKYCYVSKERAVFANIDDGNAFPHLIVGSKRGDYTNITVSNRPSSSLSAQDPWFLVQPDNRPVNGIVEAFNETVTSSKENSLYKLTGTDATDFAFEELFPRLGAKGDESLVWAGNDIFYGRAGHIESVRATDQFGDVERHDLSFQISDEIADFDDWLSVYNSRFDRAYFFPSSGSSLYVLYKDLMESDVSPWSKWTTSHSLSFNPTFAMNMLDPSDGLEYVFMGDDSGNIYRLEGSGSSGDGGTDSVRVFRESILIRAPLDAYAYNVYGWVLYRLGDEAALTLDFLHAGERLFDERLTITLTGATAGPYYSNSAHYSDGHYYGREFSGRLTRARFQTTGASNEVQVHAEVSGTVDFTISEIGLRFEAAS